MPDMDGFTVCQRIREHVSCPILFLTARVETGDKIKGFTSGADDYIVKPFDLEELGARVAAHLRRETRIKKQNVLRFFSEKCPSTIQDISFKSEKTLLYSPERNSPLLSFCL